MGEISMVTPDVDRGKRTVQMLDQGDVQAYAAFWYLEDSDQWTFYLYTPLTDKFGKRHAYAMVRRALGDHSAVLSLREITLLAAHSPLLELLGRVFVTPYQPGLVHQIDVVNSTIDGHLIRKAYIYRLAVGAAFTLRIDRAIAHLTDRLNTDPGSLAPAAGPSGETATMPPNWQERQRIESALTELYALRTVIDPAGQNPTIDQLSRLWEMEYEWGLMDPVVYRP